MILPNNGKVVIFDDKQKDIESLLKALSKESIPFLYYQDELGNDLPNRPIENIRLIFLDLELISNNSSEHSIISPIAARLKRVLTPNNTYILIYWSTKEDQYRPTLERAFEEGLREYKPVLILSLDKVKANKSANPAQFVIDALSNEMGEFRSINAFMLWESCVNDSAGRITNEIASFINKAKWDKGMYGFLHKLSKAQAGSNTFEDQDNNSKLNLAFEVINHSLVETTERLFNERLELVKIGDIKDGGRDLQPEERTKLNTRLHLINSENLHHFYSGNLYILEINGLGREIIMRNFNDAVFKQFENGKTKLICLDITPSCDYAQRKYYTRVIYGVMIEEKFKSQMNTKDNKYKHIPIVNIDGEVFLLLDFRTLRSYTREEFLLRFKDQPKYRLRSNLLLDIQAQLSNHINRPGIVSI